MDKLQIANIDAEFHRRRAEEQLQISSAESVLTLLPVLIADLSGMLQAFYVAK